MIPDSNRIARRWVCAVALACVAGAAGVHASTAEASTSAEVAAPQYDREKLLKSLDEIDSRRLSVETLVARLDIVLRDKNKDKEHALNGAYLGDKDGNLRLRIKHQETLLLDMAFHEGSVDLLLPRKRRYFRGSVEDLKKAGGNELALLAHAGTAHDLFFPRPWTETAFERRVVIENGKPVVSVLEMPGVFKRRVRSYQLSSEHAVATRADIFDLQSQFLGAIRFEDYRFKTPGAGEAAERPTDLTYPGRVTLATASDKQELQLDVQELIPNVPIPIEKLRVPVPEGMQIRDLAEALQTGQSLWE